jgi:phage-related tail protein
MSVVAKILVVLNLVLAVMFLGVAATFLGQQESWKVKYNQMQEQKDAEIATLQTNYDRTQESYSQQQIETSRIQNMYTELSTLSNSKQEEYRAVEEKYNELLGSYNRLSQTARELQSTIDDLNSDKNRLTGEKDAALAEKRQAVDAMNDAVTEQNRLAAAIVELEDGIGELEKRMVAMANAGEKKDLVIGAYEKEYGKLGDVLGYPLIKATVSAVSGKSNIVMLSVGRDDAVKVGYKFTVYRGSEYVGTVVVDSVERDHCSGYSEKEIERKPIMVGDAATTRF